MDDWVALLDSRGQLLDIRTPRQKGVTKGEVICQGVGVVSRYLPDGGLSISTGDLTTFPSFNTSTQPSHSWRCRVIPGSSCRGQCEGMAMCLLRSWGGIHQVFNLRSSLFQDLLTYSGLLSGLRSLSSPVT
jgi:hypothetical protein